MGMKKQNMVGMLAMMAAMSVEKDIYSSTRNFTEDDYLKMQTIKQPKKPKKIIPKGMKEFFYGTEKIYALNQKNADRKARKKGYI
jgi:hypothetical protein